MTGALSNDLLDRVCDLASELPSALCTQLAAAVRSATTSAEAEAICHRMLPHLSADSRALFRKLVLAWQAAPSVVTGVAVAASLEAAVHQAARLRDLSGVELVWTGPNGLHVDMRSTEQVILDMVRSAQKSIFLVTFAAYRVGSIAEALREAIDRGVRVSFILEDKDESDGKVTMNPLPALYGHAPSAAKVYAWPLDQRPRNERGHHGTLHAKCVLVDGRRLFVSSANMTEFALSLNIELGVLLRDGDAPRQMERSLAELIRRGAFKEIRMSRH